MVGMAAGSRPARALWIEIPLKAKTKAEHKMSRPARALWIEILTGRSGRYNPSVEAREGLVD